ncbi:ATPase-like protein [Candidatus Nitrospira nitrosa]|uniref:ATPase-like protein n=1 Tax=Candidatus Nitrospira nitrosa TaxID=1742972 RepID=A0A0S4LAM2_9BACT|nr:MoxR family ATPase [Candidatus Nitrospira nitrosa]CUS33833.1 ATPase-like protein [Candidatus Nitrospira nitrosa]
MTELPYSESPPASRPTYKELAPPILGGTDDPAGYLADRGLVDAVNVALLLRQPLLVTGEPGTGKSQLAFSVAYQLGLAPPLTFETKSTSVARDLFYTFDNIGRFRAAQTTATELPVAEFISFNALGRAILLANPQEQVQEFLPGGYTHFEQRRSVVLIDEIDKAPRDFPNDILNEVERFFFRVPEAGGRIISAPADFKPIVIMTSNSEKALPEAFLRRCIFYSIPFPDPERLEEIVFSRLIGKVEKGAPLLQEALEFFLELRHPDSGFRKKPGTAELLNWLVAMLEFGCDPNTSLRPQYRTVEATLSALSKLVEDQGRLRDDFRQWLKK